MPRYRNYIFDLYGTLADILTNEASPRFWRLMALYFGYHGAGYTAPELREAYLRLCKEEQAKSPDPLFEIELRRVFRSLYREKGVGVGSRLVEETARAFRLTSTEKLKLYPWVKPVLGSIREQGAGVFLLSNAQACFTHAELRSLGIDGAFDAAVLSSEVGMKKPSPAIMSALLEGAGLDPRDCIMVGNDRQSDIALANSFGMDSLYIKTETSGEQDPVIRATYELPDGRFTRIPGILGL